MSFRPLTDPETGEQYLPIAKSGDALLNDEFLNKGDAFSRDERTVFGLTGLLPDHVASIDEQLLRVRVQFDSKTRDIDKNVYLNALMDRNETLFYRFVLENLEEVVPVIYTPVVAKACSHWSRIYRKANGLYITPRDRGRIAELLVARPVERPPVIVVTDNERILGIGDQGAGGMGIPIGKLALYTAAAGIHPGRCIPISIDVGTNNSELLDDPLYVGYRQPRLRGKEYDDLIDEFVDAVRTVFPGALLQWEDFANRTSFGNLDRHRKRITSFNDDIQGTAAMVVGGLIAATRSIETSFNDHKVVIVGAGSAGHGIRAQIARAMAAAGADIEKAKSQIFVLDSRGLVTSDRTALSDIKADLATPAEVVADWDGIEGPYSLLDVVSHVQPSVLIGVSGRAGLFTEDVITALGETCERPIVMPLSNPTSHTEVTPANAILWTGGRAIVATGSPFSPVEYEGETHRIGQANNVFIFPGMGLGVITVRAREVTDGMFLAAARALADETGPELVAQGQLYPNIADVRDVSRSVALAVARTAIEEGVADQVDDLEAAIDAEMWTAQYLPYRQVGE
ncbi:MAG: NAD-dependent malic enzyme [Acidimicrobiia bacterium]